MTTGNDIIKPRTRLAKFLAKIAGVYDEPIEPKTEIEKYLKEIAENGSGGGNVLTLYVDADAFDNYDPTDTDAEPVRVYKDILRTKGWSDYLTARDELLNATFIRVIPAYTDDDDGESYIEPNWYQGISFVKGVCVFRPYGTNSGVIALAPAIEDSPVSDEPFNPDPIDQGWA